MNNDTPIRSMQSLEEMLQEKDSREYGTDSAVQTRIESIGNIPKQKSDKGATMEDFIEMLSMLITKSMKKSNVVFEPDEGARPKNDAAVPLESPHIYYEVIDSVPKSELKARNREQIVEITDPDNENSKRQGTIWGQKFKCRIQFNILASGYKEANKVMNSLEDLIFRYTGFFKENGVSELLFSRHYTDKTLDPYRQKMSIRSIQYYVELEKLYTVFSSEFRYISVTR